MNDDAIFREPMTLDDYLAARYVSKPLRILDCDYPVDSGSAVIFTTEERARDLRPAGRARRVVRARPRSATSTSRSCRDMVHTAPVQTAKKLWERTDLTPDRRRHRAALRRLLDHRVPVARGARVLRRG